MVAVLKPTDLPTPAEFHEAITARGDRWYAACLRITRNAALAEDAVQDALLSAWNKRHQYERSARLDTWIHRIAVNAALQLIRKVRPDSTESIGFELTDDTPTPDEMRENDELNSDLMSALHRLTDIERVCFVLKHLEQWRLKEIAEELDTGIGTIKQALFRAVKKLRVSMVHLRSA